MNKTRRSWSLFWMAAPVIFGGIASESRATTEGIQVRYRRGELTSSAAAHRLLKRIGDAALESCGASSFSLAEVKIAAQRSRCWRDAVDAAVRRIDSPVLTEVASKDRRQPSEDRK